MSQGSAFQGHKAMPVASSARGTPSMLLLVALLVSPCVLAQVMTVESVDRLESFWASATVHSLQAGDNLPRLLEQITATADDVKHVVNLSPGSFDMAPYRARLNITSHIRIVGAGADQTKLMQHGHEKNLRVVPGASLEIRGVTIVGLVLEGIELVGTPGELVTVDPNSHAVVYYRDLTFIGASDDVDVTRTTTFDAGNPICGSTATQPCTFNYQGLVWKLVLLASQKASTLLLGSMEDVLWTGTNVKDPVIFPEDKGFFALKWQPMPTPVAAGRISGTDESYSIYVLRNVSSYVDPDIPVMRELFAELETDYPGRAGLETCFNFIDRGFTYRGSANITSAGIPCLAWDDPKVFPPLFLPNVPGSNFTSVEGNVCRNPRASEIDPPGPWCWILVNGTTTSASCGVPACTDIAPANDHDHRALVIGLSVGAAALLLIALVLLAWCMFAMRRKRQRSYRSKAAPPSYEDPSSGIFQRSRPRDANQDVIASTRTQLTDEQDTSCGRSVPNPSAIVLSQVPIMQTSGKFAPPAFDDDEMQRSIIAERRAEAGVIQRVCDEHDNEGVALLERQLDALFADPEPFLGRYKLLSSAQRRVGGQGVVQFARQVGGEKCQVAMKFFLHRVAFTTEQAHYATLVHLGILPPVNDVLSNEYGTIRVLGRPLPPMVVTERGEPLDEWARRCRPDFSSSMNIIIHLVDRACELHRAGIVHRDLKPSNTMFLYSRNEWTILDFGSAAVIGTQARLSFSLRWAAPETVRAIVDKQKYVDADPAVDVWALGIMAFELLTGVPAFHSLDRQQIIAMISGQTRLPWEEADSPNHEALMRRLGFMREVILQMLHRDPARRITLSDAQRAWQRVLGHETGRELYAQRSLNAVGVTENTETTRADV